MRIRFSREYWRSFQIDQVKDHEQFVYLHENNQSDDSLFKYLKNFIINDHHKNILNNIGEV